MGAENGGKTSTYVLQTQAALKGCLREKSDGLLQKRLQRAEA
jgi:hypothetical protein